MIRINLLPHREEKRKQRKNAFFMMLALFAIAGAVVVLVVGIAIANQISDQNQRNDFIKAENTKLDAQIKEIAALKDEIASLKARQQAVEDLQGDRNQPVYLMDELVKQVPEGVYLRGFKQDGQKVDLQGYAQSNERVSELLRNLGNSSPWLEKPELIDIHFVGIGQGKSAKRVADFSINVLIKRPRDKEKDKDKEVPAQAGAQSSAGATSTAPKKP
jgi:type IV pilus assembly protein PilN